MDALQVQRDMTQNGGKRSSAVVKVRKALTSMRTLCKRTEELETENARSAAPRLNREHQDERHSQADG